MKLIVTSIVLSLLTLPALSQPTFSSPWIGLWQAPLEGQPGVILTLGDDNGQLGGGIVFNVGSRDGQFHIIGHDAHAIMNPQVDGDTLRFQVIRRRDNLKLEITARMTADGKADLNCRNCGGDAPKVEITRER